MSANEQAELERAVLEANAKFYRAFSRGDVVAMTELWSTRVRVSCLHPGAPLLLDEAVLASWQTILKGAPPFRLRCDSPVVQLLGSVAVVLCYEGGDTDPAHLAATNVFVLEDGTWRMTHHHAGPLSIAQRATSTSRFMN
jgi:hypothetical protein